MIPFNKPAVTGKEIEYIAEAIANEKICGDGGFTQKCNKWLKEKTKTRKVLITTSCTHALEMAAILADIKEGDEIIMPAFTFVSTADAFVMRGAKIIFVDIRPDTMNIDENLIESAITSKTKAIVPVHYAGVSCEMDKILRIAEKHNLLVVEDAAQGVMATYKGQALGSIGDFGCYSFHETKNYSSGEGGAILIKDDKYVERAEIIREKGTNRSKFWRGQVDKYTWVDLGSSYLPSELNAAYLYAQLEEAEKINNHRLILWNLYNDLLQPLQNEGKIELPTIPKECEHNAHMFYIKAKDLQERTELITFLKENNIGAVFHYIPLHTSPAGLKFGRFHGEDAYTTSESEKLLRLPMYYSLTGDEVRYVVEKIKLFYNK
ncbi:dTDP-4-amino-4,6-dideoxygalactose transaminase [Clostridium beijerinckii]|uniref:dTDP-4-amino-4,6-dideoxygalactose transaminase n=1 Tax=Clostridium beijerinckii TaxID=1520 RepID=UPI00136137D9|nr:dTDP-4-amino-4,6-dideoxygalactose transaminase [Clostridium beijerinckii]MZK53464.1 dTDP-4-amino-4,6-dideoxygalactose transaminase [Clostridium beijerinckii]MZK61602.1 dTDP-4-amino-4,6-dideoxygalactose transaminase [Clostridium beijerinckii]MZK71888.1 dTDP-4-amino-4,6-dideoxygalactose transaminase [Clostridium beijerinckii]MZK77231.1 dTDP-4-amino-4,6-dideoxygalactose transaminase [Clostridium beijerinckii]MZK86859.1 dTDP-4-amino-4,6-dideoxygalactose transaminase [Clostridium beijerinckii]